VRDFGRPGCPFRVDDELADAGVVAQVDEDEASVIPPARHPAGQRQSLAHAVGPRLAAH